MLRIDVASHAQLDNTLSTTESETFFWYPNSDFTTNYRNSRRRAGSVAGNSTPDSVVCRHLSLRTA
ncbi:MAG: hypothetical protein GFH27_549279n280 [Chloroflexi bacterium AL-W]|nr:hypothetical protein [Chloroflexi bacterium AL-N1]NOK65246.1 hypothetical protein [Chloroflexi bacterium AL-N10]NOK72489.1 hypothetical protein [Chloroflexi bacterium AL-N5]NOK79425.1 hypothetical protein [Chloroflexi bacterium AL-W]NOK87341.1 hypothetical protein [Chloroflexi bacterium AL-N15]